MRSTQQAAREPSRRTLKIDIVTPAPRGSRKGNRITALRWGRLLRKLGHHVSIRTNFNGAPSDVLIALHARRSADAVRAYREAYPDRPIVLALTGTDLYQDIHTDRRAQQALELASRLVVLQALALRELPKHLHAKTRVILQSCVAPRTIFRPRDDVFEVCVLGHLRPVKDPFRTSRATRLLPVSSTIRVLQVGEALTPDMARMARAEEARNPRYRWLGVLPRWRALRVLARCRLLVLTSRSEGGANVISEALAVGVPVLSTDIPGSTGVLGPDYPGIFPFGDTKALAALLDRAETDPQFYSTLKRHCERLRPLVQPARELHTWKSLLAELRP